MENLPGNMEEKNLEKIKKNRFHLDERLGKASEFYVVWSVGLIFSEGKILKV